MARITAEQADKYAAQGESNWLRLANDGDVAKVQFMYENSEDLDIFAAHKVKVGDKDRWVNCIREYDDPVDVCPLCESGLKPQVTMMLAMVDINEKSIKIWERGKSFIAKMQSLANRYNPLSNQVFEIERNGKPGDQKTKYEFFPMQEQGIDISTFEKPNFLGTIILDKDAEEMLSYLNTGAFPEVAKEEQTTQTGRRQTAAQTEAPVRRGRRG